MRRVGGIVSLTGVVVAVALVTLAGQARPFDSPGLAQGRQGGASRATAKPYTTWQSYAGGAHSSQYSGLDQINKKTVAKLDVAWTFPIAGASIFNPVVIDGVMYAPVGGGALAAIDAATGKEIWRKEGVAPSGARGMNYWESADRSDRRFIFLQRGDVIAVNAQNGEPITSFGNNGRVDLRDAMERKPAGPVGTSNPGRNFGNLFIIPLPGGANYGGPPSDVHAYDVRSGKLAWIFHVIPHEGEFGYDTWPEGHYKVGGGGHNWSEFTVDEENGIEFVGFGSPRFDFYGGDRRGNNLFANSLVALDARTGKRLGHYPLVHHDLWDYDLPQAPKLLTLKQNGRNIDVVAQASKFGFIYVFERKTGKPVFPIEERPVPQSDVPGEVSSPTQPFPMKVPPFARQSFTEKDINPYLPEAEKERLRQLLKSVRNEGLFTPPSLEGSIELPGHNGGANWGSTAADPTKGELYVVAKNMPTLMRLVLSNEEPTAGGALGGGAQSPIVTAEQKAQLMAVAKAAAAKGPVRYTSPYDFMQSPTNGMTAIGPPWSEITAYDLNTGEIKWRIPDGGVTAPAEANIPANTGAHMPRGGPLVTAGGLLFVATASDRTVRAYDRETGKVVWSKDLPTGSEGVPATYEVGGRQFIVLPVAAGAGLFPARFGGPAPARGVAPAAAA